MKKDQPTSQPANQPTSQPANQPTSQPANQPTSQPASTPAHKSFKRKNQLLYGDCLTFLKEWNYGEVDLIYLDPPFNSNRNYNAIYKTATGHPLPEQVEAFCDAWEWTAETENAVEGFPKLVRQQDADANLLLPFINNVIPLIRDSNSKLAAYLVYMTERLICLRNVLKDTGSIYLHCDPTASHYLKMVMDFVFGSKRFQNEFIWYYSGGGASHKRWARKHDVILFYAKGKKWIFNADIVRVPHKWNAGQLRADGSQRDYSKGKLADDVWERHSIMPWAKEHLGYPTQKPLALLERIISASSNKGDLVLDPFCGCATTIESAHKLGRRWIGIDIAIHAIKRVATVRLKDNLGLTIDTDFRINGVPTDWEGAYELWNNDKYQFQKWAVEQVNGFVTAEKTRDGGVDGRLYFHNPKTDDLENMIIEVKGGKNVKVETVRALRGTRPKRRAKMAGLILLEKISKQTRRNWESEIEDGFHEVLEMKYPRCQLLTVEEILKGKRFHTPSVAGRGIVDPVLPGISSDTSH